MNNLIAFPLKHYNNNNFAKPNRDPDIVFEYSTENQFCSFQKRKWILSEGDKTFHSYWLNPLNPDEQSMWKIDKTWLTRADWQEWEHELGELPIVHPYNAAALADPLRRHEPVYVCEGEKDADTIIGLGLIGTTNHTGAGNWNDSHSEHLRGRDVVVFEDNDDMGRRHASKVRASLAGIAKSVRIVGFKSMAEKSDVTDWVNADTMRGKNALLAYIETQAPKERFRMTWADNIDLKAPREQALIEDVFAAGEFTIVSGLPGSGKSAIITDAACAVASGTQWHGKAVKQGLVVYFAAERDALVKRRVAAWKLRQNTDVGPLAIVSGALAMTNGEDAESLVAKVKELQEEADVPCVWVIIDTLSRTFGGLDQNTSKDMLKYVAGVDKLLLALGCHVTVVHHTTWQGDRGKGAIDLDGAVDASFLVKLNGNKRVFSCDGANDMAEGDLLHFMLDSVALPSGDEAPVVVKTAAPTDAEKVMKSPHTAVALMALRQAIAEGGETDGSAKLDVWHEFFNKAQDKDVKAGTVQQRFQRAQKALAGAAIIKIVDRSVHLVRQSEDDVI